MRSKKSATVRCPKDSDTESRLKAWSMSKWVCPVTPNSSTVSWNTVQSTNNPMMAITSWFLFSPDGLSSCKWYEAGRNPFKSTHLLSVLMITVTVSCGPAWAHLDDTKQNANILHPCTKLPITWNFSWQFLGRSARLPGMRGEQHFCWSMPSMMLDKSSAGLYNEYAMVSA